MKKPIYFCNISVEKFSQRGKTITVIDTKEIQLPLVTINIEELTVNNIDMHFIAKKFTPKSSYTERVSHFFVNHRIKSINVIKQIGETYESIDDEWL